MMQNRAQDTYQERAIPEPSPERVSRLFMKLSGEMSLDSSDPQEFCKLAHRFVQKEDNAPYTDTFFKLKPNYTDLTQDQLRGYFTWRAKVRRGRVEKAPLPFAFLYCFELINLIGVPNPTEGYRKLMDFREHFSLIHKSIVQFLNHWIRDFVLFYALDPALLAPFYPKNEPDSAAFLSAETVLDPNSPEIFPFLTDIAAYKIEKSAFYAQEGEALRTLISRVFADIWNRHRLNPKEDPVTGTYFLTPYVLFKGAQFSPRHTPKNSRVILPNGDMYVCAEGSWYFGQWYPPSKDTRISNLLKTAESRLRKALRYKRAIKEAAIPQDWSDTLNREIATLLCEKKKKRAASIVIDRSKLETIRIEAQRTQNSLLTEEEKEEAREAELVIKKEPMPENTLGLTEKERGFVASLLNKQAAHEPFPELLADAVNEKLFDQFSDTVIVFENNQPLLLDDYKEQVKDLLGL